MTNTEPQLIQDLLQATQDGLWTTRHVEDLLCIFAIQSKMDLTRVSSPLQSMLERFLKRIGFTGTQGPGELNQKTQLYLQRFPVSDFLIEKLNTLLKRHRLNHQSTSPTQLFHTLLGQSENLPQFEQEKPTTKGVSLFSMMLENSKKS